MNGTTVASSVPTAHRRSTSAAIFIPSTVHSNRARNER